MLLRRATLWQRPSRRTRPPRAVIRAVPYRRWHGFQTGQSRGTALTARQLWDEPRGGFSEGPHMTSAVSL